jgi:hypothetical protein
MKTKFRTVVPLEAWYLLGIYQLILARVRGKPSDAGEVGIIGAIIMVVGFAVAATLLVAAVKGKLSSWISQIPG